MRMIGRYLLRYAMGAGLLLGPVLSNANPPLEFDPMSQSPIQQAIILMDDYAIRTGLDSERPIKRYLWTDAFAVCNYLGLARATGKRHYRDLALRLVNQIHHTLGRHPLDDPREGWISGLDEQAGEDHPTRGGLRIGKPLPERGPQDPFDERLEWERDGQYFHYLTKWMHALDQLSRATGDPSYNRWARELAATAYAAFTLPATGNRPARLYWKMSIDLSRPLVTSMGQHDPLDGYITALQLDNTAATFPPATGGPDLTEAIQQFKTMTKQGDWASPDPLGIGGLMVAAYRVSQLSHLTTPEERHLLARLLSAALTGLQYYAASGELQAPAEYRLAFRELGLAIGLMAGERIPHLVEQDSSSVDRDILNQLHTLSRYFPLSDQIRDYWSDSRHRNNNTWQEHRDINEVMLATSLVPDRFLEITEKFKGR